MSRKIVRILLFGLIAVLFSSCVNLFSVFTPRDAAGTSNPEELVAIGQYHMQQMEYSQAYEAYKKALELDSDNALALEGAGAAYFYMKLGVTNVLEVATTMMTNTNASSNDNSAFASLINVQDLYSAFHYMSGNYEKIVSGQADDSLSRNDSVVTLFYLASAGLDTVFQLVDLDGDGIITNDPDDFVTFTNLNPFVLDGSSNTSMAGVPILFESSGLSITNDLNDLVDGLTNGTNSLIAKTNEYIDVISNRLFSNLYALFTNGELNITNDIQSVTNLLDSVTNDLGTVTNSLIPQISNVLSNTLEQTNDVVSNLNGRVSSLSNWLTNRQVSISNWVIAKTNAVMSDIIDLTNDISTNVGNMNTNIDNFTNNIKSFTNDVNTYLADTGHTNLLFDAWKAASIRSNRLDIESDYTSLTNNIDTLTNRVNALPQDVTNLVDTNVIQVNDYVDSNYTDITNHITTNIDNATNFLYSEVDRITNELTANITNLISTNLQPILDDVVTLLSNVDNITNRIGSLTNRFNEILTNDAYTMFSNFMNRDLPDIIQPYLDDFLTNSTAYNSMLSNPGTTLLFQIPAIQRRLTNRIAVVRQIASNLTLNIKSSNIRSMIAPIVDPLLGADSPINYIEDPVSYFTSTNSSMTDAMMLSVTTNLLTTIFDSTNSSPSVSERDTMFRGLFKNAIPALSDTIMSNFDLNSILSNVDLNAMLSNVDVDSYFTNPDISNYLSYTNMDILMDSFFSNATTNIDLSSVFDTVESNLNVVKSNLNDTNALISVSTSDLLSGVTYPSNVTVPTNIDSGFSDAVNLTTNVNQYTYVEPFHVDTNNSTMVDTVSANSNTRESNVVIFLTNEGMNTVSDLYDALTNVDSGFSVNVGDGISSAESNQIIQHSIEILTNGYDDLTNMNILINVMTNTYGVDGFSWSAIIPTEIRISPPRFFDRSLLPEFYRRKNELSVLG